MSFTTTTPGAGSTAGTSFGWSGASTGGTSAQVGLTPTTAGSFMSAGFGTNPFGSSNAALQSAVRGQPPNSSLTLQGLDSVEVDILYRIQELEGVYNPASPDYKFKFFFYRKVNEPSHVNFALQEGRSLQDLIGIPPEILQNNDTEAQQLWALACADNPDKKIFIPDFVKGTEAGLLKRLKQHAQHTQFFQAAIARLQAQLETLRNSLKATTASLLAQCKRDVVSKAQRTLEIFCTLEFYNQTFRHPAGLTRKEEEILFKLEDIHKKLVSPPTQYQGQLNELKTIYRSVKDRIETPVRPVELDFNSIGKIYQFLEQQQLGLNHLCAIIKEDFQKINTMRNYLKDSTLKKR
ncbi:uncharacterized protein LOC135146557 isoform X1 [Zophobas morio]|uniref:uncharacterized protein LOC135146557 isoform X1 n=1 Tax=Zophobas morio TaxID=2755281 RepID=UPI003082F631